MLKLNATSGTLTANSTIPFTQEFNSNDRFIFNNNTIQINSLGFTEINGCLTLIATAIGDVTINMYDKNNNVLASYTQTFSAIGDYATIPIYNLLRIIPTNISNGLDSVTFKVNSTVTINNGIITVKTY